MELEKREFYRFRDLISRHSGINLTEEKRELLKSRVLKRLRALGIPSFREYYRHVTEDPTGGELIHLIDVISTNETSFFREGEHFTFVREQMIPQILRSKNGEVRDRKRVRGWSAGCSTGEEPYSIAMTLYDALSPGLDPPPWEVKILATDISTAVLDRARKGVYPRDRVGALPWELLRRHFQAGVGRFEGYCRVKPHLREMISFRRLNLFREPYPFQGPFDFIFCRNVTIYFKKEDQERLINRFYHLVRPSGYLFLGHSESLIGIRSEFRYIRPTIYRKG